MFSSSPTQSVGSLTKENRAERRNRLRRKFKAIVRLVIANLYWIGDPEDAKISDNVRRNIRMLMRRKKVKSVLTIKEKSILNKPKEYRTEEDQKILAKSISGLKCFRKYPSGVKEKLAAITYFCYFPAGRVIIKQDHMPDAMYFILQGECSVTISRYDNILQEVITDEVGVMTQGNVFGEVALLHGTGRLATVTTTTHCEFLMIKKEDFDNVLKETVAKSWEAIKVEIDRFSYFKNWDSVTKRECCIMAKTRNYDTGEIVLGDDIGFNNYAYLITKGTCTIIENLRVWVNEQKGVKYFKLDPLSSCPSDQTETVSKIFSKYWKRDGRVSQVSTITSGRSKASTILSTATNSYFSSKGSKQSKQTSFLLPQKEFRTPSKVSSISASTFSDYPVALDLTDFDEENESMEQKSNEVFYVNYELETHFIQLCEMHTGAVFNVGENLDRRRIVAETPVTCLLIPRYFILKNNMDNMWTIIKQFLTKHIPDTRGVYDHYIKEQKFKLYKKTLVKQILEEKVLSNDNSIHNVPYSIRLRDGVDANYL
ncbi:uncharacterized protein LOC130893936 [Diorhabda carinulata]|uniref:uncharacterized protein LOC130893936 n=1 Tax=Diorhabda carinulata TaxID=1163345 RepID=UPI0025A1D5C7|nr:uncharacterized protein LOC130893936 [Diorhabda carinulata]